MKRLSSALYKLRSQIPIDRSLKISSQYSLILPPEHSLPHYISEHPQYDKFLPFLGAHLPDDYTVIDVGANVGDTLAFMHSHAPYLSYLCIEPDKRYFQYLTTNIRRNPRLFDSSNIILENAFVSASQLSGYLDGRNGTKSFVSSPSKTLPIPSKTIDGLVAEYKLNGRVLLKSDIDGYDFDVIQSACSLLSRSSTILYFEAYCPSSSQLHSYHRAIDLLWSNGYKHFWVFDNLGAHLCEASTYDCVKSLLSYSYYGKNVPYLDILCCTSVNHELLNSAVSAYSDYFSKASPSFTKL